MGKTWLTIFAASAAMLVSLSAQAGPGEARTGIAVEGKAEIRVLPNRAELTVAVEQRNASAEAASKAANAAAAEFVRGARELGADERSIQSASLRLSPEYRWDDARKQRERIGYRARRDITVRIETLDKLADYLALAADSGMTHISPPRLYAAEADAHKRKALRQAMADARANAEAIAKATDRAVGMVVSVDAREQQRHPIQPRAMMRTAADSGQSGQNAEISTGEIVYSANLRARFAFAP